MASNKEQQSGFTIIEVVLVLAIAGLIFLMVFIALPALQKGQRDTQRKRDLGILVAAMNQWYTNNKSSIDDSYKKYKDKTVGFCTFYKKYVGPNVVDPSTGKPYRAGLWNGTNVVDCIDGKTYPRGIDTEVVGASANSKWPAIEVGDFQFNQGAMCDGEKFVDIKGKAKLKVFAFRMKFESGATVCMDNGIQYNISLMQNFLENYHLLSTVLLLHN